MTTSTKELAILASSYKPITGGAEVYVDNLAKIAGKHGYYPTVFQLATDNKSAEIIHLPKIAFLSKPLNFSLMLFRHVFKLLKQKAIIVSYPEYFFPVFWHRNVIVISHGAIWTDKKGIKRKLVRAISKIVSKFSPKYVVNDTFVPRELGIDIKPGTRFFEEIRPGIWFIPNCVDCEKFKPVEPDQELKKENLILVPRNLTYGRGIDLAVRAFALFCKKHPETRLGLVGSRSHLGSSQDKYVALLLKLIDDLGLSEKVLFLGHLENDAMPKVYSSSIMTVIPTRHREGTSLAALESMACKTPTISTNIEGLLDLPTYKCEVQEKSIAIAMEFVFQERENLGQEQFEEVRQTFNIVNWENAWIKVIENA
ncbi:MAG: glycosyltransferase family 4 protein [Candidatus Saganbacteria bacterium]|nr:glycosyltransferase family 4 protein [Candidatus Saganbacteria bacterium]